MHLCKFRIYFTSRIYCEIYKISTNPTKKPSRYYSLKTSGLDISFLRTQIKLNWQFSSFFVAALPQAKRVELAGCLAGRLTSIVGATRDIKKISIYYRREVPQYYVWPVPTTITSHCFLQK